MRTVLASAVVGMMLMTSNGAGAAPLVAAAATTTTTTTTTTSGEHRWHMPTVEERVKHMTASLELTPAQIPKVTALLQQADAQRKQRMEAFAASMKSIMTPDQQAKMEQMRQEWSQGRKDGQKTDGQKGRSWGHRQHVDLGLTPQQQIQMHVLRNQNMHLMKADRENLLAQMSGVLSPLQEKAYEQSSRHGMQRFSDKGGRGQSGNWHKGGDHKGSGHKGPHADADGPPATVGEGPQDEE